MKSRCLSTLLLLLLFLPAGLLNGQVEVLHRFPAGAQDGENPFSGLIPWGGAFYGLTMEGGAHGAGTIYQINGDGSGYRTVFSFPQFSLQIEKSIEPFSYRPSGQILAAYDRFYGVLQLQYFIFNGGPDMLVSKEISVPAGYLYSINPDGSDFTLLHAFDQTPLGSLLEFEGALFGLLPGAFGIRINGDPYENGAVFRINLDGSAYRVIHVFDGQNGHLPLAGLTAVNGVLFGTTAFAESEVTVNRIGDEWEGIFYRINPDGSDFTVLYRFHDDTGSVPSGTLVFEQGWFYGKTGFGGSAGGGNVFRINPLGGGFQELHAFPIEEDMYIIVLDEYPLLFYGAVLYGTKKIYELVDVKSSPVSGKRTLFTWAGRRVDLVEKSVAAEMVDFLYRLDLDTMNFSVLHTFRGVAGDGFFSMGRLVVSGSDLLGTTIYDSQSEYGSGGGMVYALPGVMARNYYSVCASVGSGPGRVEPTLQYVDYGHSATITALPDPGYRLRGWTGDYESEANPLVIMGVTRNLAFQAHFVNDPPQVEIISPGDGQTVHGLVVIEARVRDDSGIERVEFYLNGVKQAEAASRSADRTAHEELFTFYWDSGAFPAGTHRIKIMARDRAGASGAAEIGVQLAKVEIDMQAALREIRAWSFLRLYGEINIQVRDNGLPVNSFRLLRRRAEGAFSVITEISRSELQSGAYRFQDKYLQAGVSYIYRVEALDSRGNVLGRSADVPL